MSNFYPDPYYYPVGMSGNGALHPSQSTATGAYADYRPAMSAPTRSPARSSAPRPSSSSAANKTERPLTSTEQLTRIYNRTSYITSKDGVLDTVENIYKLVKDSTRDQEKSLKRLHEAIEGLQKPTAAASSSAEGQPPEKRQRRSRSRSPSPRPRSRSPSPAKDAEMEDGERNEKTEAEDVKSMEVDAGLTSLKTYFLNEENQVKAEWEKIRNAVLDEHGEPKKPPALPQALADMEKQVELVNTERKALKATVDHSSKAITALQEYAIEADKERKAFAESFDELKKKVEAAETVEDGDWVGSRIEYAKKLKTEADKATAAAQSQQTQVAAALKSLTQQSQAASTAISAAEKMVADWKDEYHKATKRLHELSVEKQTAVSECDVLKEQLAELRNNSVTKSDLVTVLEYVNRRMAYTKEEATASLAGALVSFERNQNGESKTDTPVRASVKKFQSGCNDRVLEQMRQVVPALEPVAKLLPQAFGPKLEGLRKQLKVKEAAAQAIATGAQPS
jgi:hypothetical protein